MLLGAGFRGMLCFWWVLSSLINVTRSFGHLRCSLPIVSVSDWSPFLFPLRLRSRGPCLLLWRPRSWVIWNPRGDHRVLKVGLSCSIVSFICVRPRSSGSPLVGLLTGAFRSLLFDFIVYCFAFSVVLLVCSCWRPPT